MFWPYHKKKHGDKYALLLLDNCSAHKFDEKKISNKIIIHFFPPNVTNKHQPADMGMISTLKVGYKAYMLEKLLTIFDCDGGFKWAYKRRKQQKRGLKGLAYGGRPHILDAMGILDMVWSRDGKYAKKKSILRCWRKAGILPISWECNINNDVGSGTMAERNKKISKEQSDELCSLLKKLQFKCKEEKLDTSKEAIVLDGSLCQDEIFTDKELEDIVGNWVDIEDDPEIKSAEIDELLLQLETSVEIQETQETQETVQVSDESESDDEEATIDLPPPSYKECEHYITELGRYCKAEKLPSEIGYLVHQLDYRLREHRLSQPKYSTTLHQFFKEEE